MLRSGVSVAARLLSILKSWVVGEPPEYHIWGGKKSFDQSVEWVSGLPTEEGGKPLVKVYVGEPSVEGIKVAKKHKITASGSPALDVAEIVEALESAWGRYFSFVPVDNESEAHVKLHGGSIKRRERGYAGEEKSLVFYDGATIGDRIFLDRDPSIDHGKVIAHEFGHIAGLTHEMMGVMAVYDRSGVLGTAEKHVDRLVREAAARRQGHHTRG